ncbi:MAG: PilZ domain-containing protein [Phycisphaerales bacterium]
MQTSLVHPTPAPGSKTPGSSCKARDGIAGDIAGSPREPASFPFERRGSRRYVMSGRVTMMRRAHTLDCYRQPICCVQLNDLSDGGLSAHCDLPLEPNEPVAIFFPPRGPQRGVDLLGHIVRCDHAHAPGTSPGADGYHLAIAFDHRPAA